MTKQSKEKTKFQKQLYLWLLIFLSFCSAELFAQKSKLNQPQKTKLTVNQTENFKYKLIFFKSDNHSPTVIDRISKIQAQLKNEERIKLILSDLFNYSPDALKTHNLLAPVKTKVNVIEVKTSTQTVIPAPDIIIIHREVYVELSRDIIPSLNDTTIEDIEQQVRQTLELSGYDYTALRIKVKNKKGVLHNLIHFVDNPE